MAVKMQQKAAELTQLANGRDQHIEERHGGRVQSHSSPPWLSRDMVLVTNDEKEFSTIPGLRVENWAA